MAHYKLFLMIIMMMMMMMVICLLCSDVIVLGNGTSEVSMSVAEFYVLLFRRHRLHRNEREAVWSSVDQLTTTQLVTAEQNKLVMHLIYQSGSSLSSRLSSGSYPEPAVNLSLSFPPSPRD